MKKLYKDMRILTTNLVNAFDEKFEKEIIAEAGSISEEGLLLRKWINTVSYDTKLRILLLLELKY